MLEIGNTVSSLDSKVYSCNKNEIVRRNKKVEIIGRARNEEKRIRKRAENVIRKARSWKTIKAEKRRRRIDFKDLKWGNSPKESEGRRRKITEIRPGGVVSKVETRWRVEDIGWDRIERTWNPTR